MRKNFVAVALVIAIALTAFAVGCGGAGASNADIEKRAGEQIEAAKASLQNAEAKGVKLPDEDGKLVAKAEEELGSNPIQAVIDASTAKANIDDDIREAFDLAEGTYATARGAAQTAMNKAVDGSDMSKANQSLQAAEAKKAQAKTIASYYDPSDGPIYWANLAAQQAAEASNARAVATGQAQGVSQEQKAIAGHLTKIIEAIEKYLTGKNCNPATFTIGVTKVNADASVVTAVAVPQQVMPGQPQYFTFIFEARNGTYVLAAAPQ